MAVWMQITSGRGPEECAWVVGRLLAHIRAKARSRNLTLDILEVVAGRYPETFKSVWIAMDGDGAETFARSFHGTVQWIGQSSYRPGHKRKNWFVGVNVLKPVETKSFSGHDYNIETMRSSGPGGQHVNKTESCVRITHRPTGLSATAREARSQHLNRKLAMARLQQELKNRETLKKQQTTQTRWSFHNDLERGNPVRVFRGTRFKEG